MTGRCRKGCSAARGKVCGSRAVCDTDKSIIRGQEVIISGASTGYVINSPSIRSLITDKEGVVGRNTLKLKTTILTWGDSLNVLQHKNAVTDKYVV